MQSFKRDGSLIKGLLFWNLYTGWNLTEIHHFPEKIVQKCNLRDLLVQNRMMFFYLLYVLCMCFLIFVYCFYLCCLNFVSFSYSIFCYCFPIFCYVVCFSLCFAIFLYFVTYDFSCFILVNYIFFVNLWLDALRLDSLFSQKMQTKSMSQMLHVWNIYLQWIP